MEHGVDGGAITLLPLQQYSLDELRWLDDTGSRGPEHRVAASFTTSLRSDLHRRQSFCVKIYDYGSSHGAVGGLMLGNRVLEPRDYKGRVFTGGVRLRRRMPARKEYFRPVKELVKDLASKVTFSQLAQRTSSVNYSLSAISEPPPQAMDDTLELHVQSPAFDEECAVYSKRIGKDPLSDDSDSDYSSDHSSLWEEDSSSSSVSSVESSRHDVSKLEAYLYYFGIRGPRRRGPKLIFRTSKDVFTAPSGPEQDPRLMQLRPVYEHHKLGEDDLWATIRSKVVKLLGQRNIQHSSVDLVRFSWVENEDDEDDGGDRDDGGDGDD
ncbi:hypothetical protein EW146_g10491, partial [Bondarzewia mesenterica]